MNWLSALCALAVGTVLLVSGIAKIGQSRATRQAMDDLAVPQGVRRPMVAWALPVVELVLAVGIFVLPDAWHRVAGGAAAVLLVVFAALLARVVRAGREVSCACFGALGGGRVSLVSVGRNGALAIAAVVFAVGPRGFLEAASDVSPLPGTGWWLALLALVTAVALRFTTDLRRKHAVDALHLTDVQGRVLPFKELTDPPTYLVFLTAHCSACAALVPRLRTWPTVYGETIDIQPVLVGEPGDFRDREVFEPLVEHVLYDREKKVTTVLELRAFPSAVLLTKDQPLGSRPVSGYGPMHLELEQFSADQVKQT